MIDIVLLVGRIVLIVLLYLFLFIVMKTGIGMVKGQRKKDSVWSVYVEQGPRELRGIKIDITGPMIVGRSPGADIVIGNGYVSGRHARFTPVGADLVLEDLNSANGTYLNDELLVQPTGLVPGDRIRMGDVEIKVNKT